MKVNDWSKDLDEININEVNKYRTCELILVVEKAPTDSTKLNMIYAHSNLGVGHNLQCISLHSIYDFAVNYKKQVNYVNNTIVALIDCACNDANEYLRNETPIPLDLLTKILKLKIICIIMEDVFQYQKDALYKQRSAFFEAPLNAEGKGGKKKKDKKKKDKKKSKSKASSKGKKPPKKGANQPVEDPCSSYQTKKAEVPLQSNFDVEIENEILYVALIGFYAPQLLRYTFNNKMPITCIVEFQESETLKFETRTSVSSLDSKDFSQDQYYIYKSNVGIGRKQELYVRKKEILQTFWKRIYSYSGSEEIEKTFVMSYSPLLLKVQKKNSKIYFNQCELLYNHFAEVLAMTNDYKVYHQKYLDSLDVYDLPEVCDYVDVYCMSVYGKAMDEVPNDCMNVGILLEFLIDEVCNNLDPVEEVATIGSKTCKGKHENHHGDFRDQLKKTLEHFKYNNAAMMQDNKQAEKEISLKLDTAAYVIHESNVVEMCIRYYTYLHERIVDVWVKSLMKNYCLKAWKLLLTTPERQSFNNGMKIWSSILKMSEADLYTAINIFLAGQFQCVDVQASDMRRDIEMYFPVRNIQFQLAPYPEIVGFTSSMDSLLNFYEHVFVDDFKFEENLPAIQMLQELHKGINDFECVDTKYVAIEDAILFRFHHKADEYGIVLNNWRASIRTPVHLNDFLSYVVYDDTKYILKQVKRHRDLANLRQRIIKLETMRNTFEIKPDDFELRSSKYKKEPADEIKVDDSVPRKQSKKKAAGSKIKKSKESKPGKGGKKKGTKSKTEIINAREIVEGNRKIIDVGFDTLQSEPSLNYLPKLIAFNFGGKRIGIRGSSTAFYSMDELKVVVDKTKICEKSFDLTLTVSLNGNDVIVHRNSKEFAFHIITMNGTLAAFGPQLGAAQKRHQMYLLREYYKKNTNCLSHNDEFKRKLLILSPLLQKIKRTLSVDLNEKANRALEYATNPDDKYLTRKMFVEEMVLLCAKAMEPKFRICSSRLHKYSYANRVKSPLQLQLKQIIKIFKSKKPKTKNLKLKSCHPIINKENCNFDLNVRFTLPNGLHIRNVPGEKRDLFYINQFYFQKEPQYANIADEQYRTFLRNGYVAVRKIDGTFVIYGVGGEIVTYELPFVATGKEKHNCIFKKKIKSIRTSQKVLKSVRQKLKRLLVHTISSYQCRVKQSRRAPTNGVKKYPPLQKSGSLKNVFNFVTTEGKKIKISRSHITVDSSLYVLQQDQIGNNQQKFQRQDGTTIIINKEGYVQVTYSDATRVTSWYTLEPQCINISLTKEFGNDVEIMGCFTYVNMYYQYEHPNYATVIFNANNSTRLLIPENITFEHNPPENLLKIDNTTIKIKNGTVNLESTRCKRCNNQCIADLNLQPLFNDSFSSGLILLKAADTYGKEFTVKYDGSCKRNTASATKRCSDFMHKSQSLQKFAILNKDCSGKLLWTDKMFKNRLADMQPTPNEKIILYNNNCNLCTVEFRTLENLMYNNRFSMAYLKILKGNDDVDTTPAFMKQRILNYIRLDKVLKLFDKLQDTSFQNHKFNVLTQNLSYSLLKSKAMLSSVIVETSKPVKSSQFEENPYLKRIAEWKEKCARIYDKIAQHRDNKVYPYFNLLCESIIDIYDDVPPSQGGSMNYVDNAISVLAVSMGSGKVCKSVSATHMPLDAIAQLQGINILWDVAEREEIGNTYTPVVISSPALELKTSSTQLSTSTAPDEFRTDDEKIPSDVKIELAEYVTTNLQENYKGNAGSNTVSLSYLEESEESGMDNVTKHSDSDDAASLSTMLEHDVFNTNIYARVKRLFDPSLRDVNQKIPPSVLKLQQICVRNERREIHGKSPRKQDLLAPMKEQPDEGGSGPISIVNESTKEVTSKYFNNDYSTNTQSSSDNQNKLKESNEDKVPYIRQVRKKFDVGKYLSDARNEARYASNEQVAYDGALLEIEVDDLKILHRGNVTSSADEHSLLNMDIPERSDTDIVGFEIKTLDSNISTDSSTATITNFDHNLMITPSLQGVTSIYNIIEPDFITIFEVDTGTQTDKDTCVGQQTDLYYDGKFIDEK